MLRTVPAAVVRSAQLWKALVILPRLLPHARLAATTDSCKKKTAREHETRTSVVRRLREFLLRAVEKLGTYSRILLAS